MDSRINHFTHGAAGLATAVTFALLAGCSAITSTTDTAAEAAHTIANGMSKASRASTNASVTEPDTPRHREAVAFVASQRDPLAREAAAGGGEHVVTLARLLDEPDDHALGTWMQSHYHTLFTPDNDARDVIDRIVSRRG